MSARASPSGAAGNEVTSQNPVGGSGQVPPTAPQPGASAVATDNGGGSEVPAQRSVRFSQDQGTRPKLAHSASILTKSKEAEREERLNRSLAGSMLRLRNSMSISGEVPDKDIASAVRRMLCAVVPAVLGAFACLGLIAVRKEIFVLILASVEVVVVLVTAVIFLHKLRTVTHLNFLTDAEDRQACMPIKWYVVAIFYGGCVGLALAIVICAASLATFLLALSSGGASEMKHDWGHPPQIIAAFLISLLVQVPSLTLFVFSAFTLYSEWLPRYLQFVVNLRWMDQQAELERNGKREDGQRASLLGGRGGGDGRRYEQEMREVPTAGQQTPSGSSSRTPLYLPSQGGPRAAAAAFPKSPKDQQRPLPQPHRAPGSLASSPSSFSGGGGRKRDASGRDMLTDPPTAMTSSYHEATTTVVMLGDSLS